MKRTKAISQFHEHSMDGRPLVVNEARPKPEGGFGGSGGGEPPAAGQPQLRKRGLFRGQKEGAPVVTQNQF